MQKPHLATTSSTAASVGVIVDFGWVPRKARYLSSMPISIFDWEPHIYTALLTDPDSDLVTHYHAKVFHVYYGKVPWPDFGDFRL